MKSNKRGISLIVLVITIIVMIILAASIIISLNNSGVINRANEAVDASNLSQVQQLASVIWAEAYLDEVDNLDATYITNKLKDEGIDTDKYDITVSDNGVTVKIKGTTSEDTEDETTPVATITLAPTTITETIESGATKNVTVTATTENVTDTLTWSSNNETVATVVGNGTTATITLKAAGTAVITATANGVSATCTATVTVEEAATTLGSLVTAADYGKTVNYVSDNGVTDWKIFYHTEDYVYLIASEKLAYDKVPAILSETVANGGAGAKVDPATVTLGENDTRTVGQIYWANSSAVPTSAATITNASMWMAEWANYGTYENGRCASYFLAENLWTSFKNTTKYKDANGISYVEGAIGTPTAEMFVESWNAKRLTETNTDKVALALTPNGTIGYYINGSNSASIVTTDPLYIWSTKSNSSVWLASPSGLNSSILLDAYNGGNVNSIIYNNTYYGVRPVVCLNSKIPASVGENNSIVI